jgi:hypothetical protein
MLISYEEKIKNFKAGRDEYPKLGIFIYETSWMENDILYLYVGSHEVKRIDDGYFGSSKYVKKALLNNNLSFKILFETTKENRFDDEGKLIREYIKLYGRKNIINKMIHPEKTKNFECCGHSWSENQHKNFKKTIKEKYGETIESAFQIKEVKEKIKNTVKEKYGVDHHLQRSDILQKQKETNIIKYGCENPSSNEVIKQKKFDTYHKNYTKEEIRQRYIEQNKNISPEARKLAGQKAAIKNRGKKSWFNGEIYIMSRECPGDGWIQKGKPKSKSVS